MTTRAPRVSNSLLAAASSRAASWQNGHHSRWNATMSGPSPRISDKRTVPLADSIAMSVGNMFPTVRLIVTSSAVVVLHSTIVVSLSTTSSSKVWFKHDHNADNGSRTGDGEPRAGCGVRAIREAGGAGNHARRDR